MGTKGKATTTSYSKSVSNTGQMSTSTKKTGATGSVKNTTNIRTSGDPGAPGAGWNTASDLVKYYRSLFGL